MAEGRAIKKAKHADCHVTEVRALISNHLLMYQVEWNGVFYILDKTLNLLCTRDRSIQPEERQQYSFLASDLLYPPMGLNLREARHTLGNELVDAITRFFLEGGSPSLDLYLRMELGPQFAAPKVADMDFLNLLRPRALPVSSDLLMRWTYYMLRKSKGPVHGEAITPSHVLKVLYWKGRVRRTHDSHKALFGQHVWQGEQRGLSVVCMARNRQRSDNVFAQMPRGVMQLIVEWVRWSLPLNI